METPVGYLRSRHLDTSFTISSEKDAKLQVCGKQWICGKYRGGGGESLIASDILFHPRASGVVILYYLYLLLRNILFRANARTHTPRTTTPTAAEAIKKPAKL